MRRLASGVSLVTTLDEDMPHGFLATSVSSVSAEPDPTLLVCVNRSAESHGRINRTGFFCVNLLGETQAALAKNFATAAREERFTGIEWTTLRSGAPAIPTALASFDCEIIKTVEVGSHTIFIAAVKDVVLHPDSNGPLLYHGGQFAGVKSNIAV